MTMHARQQNHKKNLLKHSILYRSGAWVLGIGRGLSTPSKPASLKQILQKKLVPCVKVTAERRATLLHAVSHYRCPCRGTWGKRKLWQSEGALGFDVVAQGFSLWWGTASARAIRMKMGNSTKIRLAK